MKICYVLNKFPLISETFISEEAQSLELFNVDFIIYSLTNGDTLNIHPTTKSILKNTQVTYIKEVTKLQSLTALFYLFLKRPIPVINVLQKIIFSPDRWRYLQALPYAKNLNKQKVNYIHAHFADINFYFASILSDWTAIPFGVTAHGGYDLREDPLTIEKFSKLANKANVIVTVSEFNKRYMVDKYKLQAEKIYVAYNGISPELFQPHKKNQHSPLLKILNVGRLVEIKGQDILLKSIQQLQKRNYSISLKIIGEGPFRKDLEQFIQKNDLTHCVQLLGAKTQETVIQLLNDADLFIMPSRSEGFAVACLEGMAMELPIIASNVTGFPEAINDYENGILVEVENIDMLTNAIIWMIDNPLERVQMGKNGRKRVLKEFTRRHITSELIKHIKSCIT